MKVAECTSMENIRPAIHADIQAVFELNLASFAEAWSHQALIDVLDHDYDLDVWRTTRGKLVAYYLGQDVLDEMHIMQLAVAPAFRRQGFGLRLTRHLLSKKQRKSMRYVYLEVRESNTAAQSFYTDLGFRIKGRRKNYYTSQTAEYPREDALMMCYEFVAEYPYYPSLDYS